LQPGGVGNIWEGNDVLPEASEEWSADIIMEIVEGDTEEPPRTKRRER